MMKKSTHHLPDNENFFKSIICNSSIGWFFIEGSKILWANVALYKMFGIVQGSPNLQGMVDNILSNPLPFNISKDIKFQLLSENTASVEFDITRYDKSYISVNMLAKHIDINDTNSGIIYTVIDVSKNKKLEYDRAESKNKIDESSRLTSIAIIASGITHEIKQPLNVIRIASDGVLLWDRMNDNILPILITNLNNKIGLAIDRIDETISHLKSLWVKFGKEDYLELDLNIIIKNTLSFIYKDNQYKSIDILFDLSEKPVIIFGNPLQIELLIINLVKNAINALIISKKDYKRIQIKTYISEIILLEISDNGLGLPDEPSCLNNLFNPFFTTNLDDNSSGLGLAIVNSIVEKYHAKLIAFNNEFGGATFQIRFPLMTKK